MAKLADVRYTGFDDISVHLISSASWIRRVISRGRQDREFGLGLLNTALGGLATACILTGFPIWLEWSES